MNIGNNLRNILNERQISMQELSRISGLPFETIKNICYGKVSDPRVSTIISICKSLDIDYTYLLDGDVQTTSVIKNDKEIEIIKNYRKCGHHGKSLIEMISKLESMGTIIEQREGETHVIDCLVPGNHTVDGINNATCTTEKIVTSVKDAYVGYKIMTNHFTDYNFCYGDIVLLEYRDPEIGEKAVFSNGVTSYFRILERKNSMYCLKPMNKQGEPIYCKRLDEWHCVGVCIDVIRV